MLHRRNMLAAAAGSLVVMRPRQLFGLAAVRRKLPIPRELRPDVRSRIAFSARAGTKSFLPGSRTSTYGYDDAFLGPALRLRRDQTVEIEFVNNLPVTTTVHWHGLVVPGDQDGGPHQPVGPGQRWRPTLSVSQPAATLWFHPHLYPSTASQVTKGLAGLLIIEDDDTDRLALPSRWGVDDFPIIIQDRRFTSDGQCFDRMNITAVTNGYVGDVPLVNGVRYPEARTTRGWVRLRLLDGSNARSYVLQASDGRPLFVIGSDGGLLDSPVELKRMVIHAGERFEVMVDCRSGTPFDLVTLPVEQPIMRLPPFDRPVPLVTIRPDGAQTRTELPSRLAQLPPLPSEPPAVGQSLIMNMFRDEDGMMPLMMAGLMALHKDGADQAVVARVTRLILDQPELTEAAQLSASGVNGRPFALGEPPFVGPHDRELCWRISEANDRMLHPVHVHGCQFRILSDSGQPPEAYRAGWKDIAPISAGGWTDILVRFPHSADASAPYMAHCHILEHEDSGMMAQFTVS